MQAFTPHPLDPGNNPPLYNVFAVPHPFFNRNTNRLVKNGCFHCGYLQDETHPNTGHHIPCNFTINRKGLVEYHLFHKGYFVRSVSTWYPPPKNIKKSLPELRGCQIFWNEHYKSASVDIYDSNSHTWRGTQFTIKMHLTNFPYPWDLNE